MRTDAACASATDSRLPSNERALFEQRENSSKRRLMAESSSRHTPGRRMPVDTSAEAAQSGNSDTLSQYLQCSIRRASQDLASSILDFTQSRNVSQEQLADAFDAATRRASVGLVEAFCLKATTWEPEQEIPNILDSLAHAVNGWESLPQFYQPASMELDSQSQHHSSEHAQTLERQMQKQIEALMQQQHLHQLHSQAKAQQQREREQEEAAERARAHAQEEQEQLDLAAVLARQLGKPQMPHQAILNRMTSTASIDSDFNRQLSNVSLVSVDSVDIDEGDGSSISPPRSGKAPRRRRSSKPRTQDFLEVLKKLLLDPEACVAKVDGPEERFYVRDPDALAKYWSDYRQADPKVPRRQYTANGVYALLGYYVRKGKLARQKVTIGPRTRNAYSFIE